MQKLPHTRSCFVCGDSNSIGLGLKMETDGTLVHVRYTPRPEHNGFRHVVHGGLLATVVDEIMVWACAVKAGQFAFCAELNVRFVSPARPGEPLHGTAELVENRRNRIFEAKADLRNQAGEVVVSATGKYMPLKGEQTQQMLDDFVSDPGTMRFDHLRCQG